MLPTPTLGKLLRDHFPGENPMHVDADQVEALGQDVRRRLKGYAYARAEDDSFYIARVEEDGNQLICAFSANEPKSWSYRDNFTIVRRGEDGAVVISTAYQEALVSSFDELDAMLADYGRRLDRRKALAAKREKVHDLKARAVAAQVRQLAVDLDFEFAVNYDTQKMILLVKLSQREAIQFNLPYKGFDKALPKLREMIASLRELHATGIRFRIVTSSQWGWRTEWISPKDD